MAIRRWASPRVQGAEGSDWCVIDGALEEVTIPGPGYLYAKRFEVRSHDCIIDAQNGFAVLQDNGTWRRISVPWGGERSPGSQNRATMRQDGVG